MSRRFTLIAALSVLLGALPVLSDRTIAEDPVPTTSPAASATETASRGVAYQETPTLPPPPTTLPPPPPTTIDPMTLPANSGNGRRAVYSKGRMRVWIIDSSNTIIRTYLVSGRRNQPDYGTYRVFSRSAYTCNIEHNWVCMRWMVRFAKGPEGDNIGFHEIPTDEGVPVQSVWQLGQALSSGCVRQATGDAEFMWNWGYIGTVVVVTP
jgi:L,D-transpeptidase catalytic domain